MYPHNPNPFVSVMVQIGVELSLIVNVLVVLVVLLAARVVPAEMVTAGIVTAGFALDNCAPALETRIAVQTTILVCLIVNMLVLIAN